MEKLWLLQRESLTCTHSTVQWCYLVLDIQGKLREEIDKHDLLGARVHFEIIFETHQEPLMKRLALVHPIEIYFHYILYKSLWTRVECVECSAHWHATVDRKWYLWAIWEGNQSFHSPPLLGVVELLHSTQWTSSWRPKRYNPEIFKNCDNSRLSSI